MILLLWAVVFCPKFVWISWNTTWLNNVPRDSVYTNIQLFLLKRIEYNTVEGCPENTTQFSTLSPSRCPSNKWLIIIITELRSIIYVEIAFWSTVRRLAGYYPGETNITLHDWNGNMFGLECCSLPAAQYNYRNDITIPAKFSNSWKWWTHYKQIK